MTKLKNWEVNYNIVKDSIVELLLCFQFMMDAAVGVHSVYNLYRRHIEAYVNYYGEGYGREENCYPQPT